MTKSETPNCSYEKKHYQIGTKTENHSKEETELKCVFCEQVSNCTQAQDKNLTETMPV